MLLTGKISEILQPDPQKTIYMVILEKTRYGKKIQIAVTVWGKQVEKIPEMKVGERWDFQFYTYSKPSLYSGRTFWNTFIVAEKCRKYEPGAPRSAVVANQNTGEVIVTKKGQIPT